MPICFDGYIGHNSVTGMPPARRNRAELLALCSIPMLLTSPPPLQVRPVKGNALIFWDMDVEGRKQDRRSLHASCPTLQGTKWTATIWIHNRPVGSGAKPYACVWCLGVIVGNGFVAAALWSQRIWQQLAIPGFPAYSRR
jgi:hypothetical protein